MIKLLAIAALSLYVVLLWLALIYAWRLGLKEWKAAKEKRIRKLPVRVVNKRKAGENVVAGGEQVAQHYVTFEIKGKTREFLVSEIIYQLSREGESGVLTLIGDQCQEFEPKKPDEQANEIYRKMVRG